MAQGKVEICGVNTASLPVLGEEEKEALFARINVKLVDFKIEFGRTSDGEIVLADEFSPDTCRLWDMTTHERLDKDRFRRDLGRVRESYEEILSRLKKITE